MLVVDDGSVDGEGVASLAARHGARVLRRDSPGGPGPARNAGLDAIDTELVAFLDSDCAPPRQWIEALAGHFVDPLVGAVAPRVRAIPALAPGRPSAIERYARHRSPLDMGPLPASVEPGGRVPFVPGAALVVRRQALDASFDPGLRYGEDVDLVWRLRDAGWRVRYDPSVVVLHEEPSTLRGLLGRRFRYGLSAAPLARRHPGRLAPASLGPAPLAALSLLLAGHPIAGTAAALRAGAVLDRRARRLGLPRRTAAGWLGESLWSAALSTSRLAATVGAPIAWFGLVRRRRRRPWLAAVLAAGPLREWWRARPEIGPVRWSLVALADDGAYGLGVWLGCIAHRTAEPLLPRRRSRFR